MRWLPGVAVVAISAALLLASPAAALTKQTTIFNLDNPFVLQAGELCAFPVAVEQGPGLIKIDDFYDNGTIVKTIVTNYGGPATFTLSANGVTLTSVQTFADFIRYNPDGSIQSVSDSGINWVFTLPHQGAVSLQVGRIVLDSNFNPIFTAGPGFATPPRPHEVSGSYEECLRAGDDGLGSLVRSAQSPFPRRCSLLGKHA